MENITQELFTRKQLENFFINQNIDINFGNFFTAILLSLILAYVVKFTYTKSNNTMLAEFTQEDVGTAHGDGIVTITNLPTNSSGS